MMKKRTYLTRATTTLLLAILFPLWGTVGQLWADHVTVIQARQQAQSFMNSRIAAGSGPHHAPGTTPQLMQEKLVSGLYVFNVTGNGGFIIVSNDDVAEPILGYSDSGTFDPNNIPDNMRAWLQGYADEIAWAKEHHSNVSVSVPCVNKVPKAPIPPMISTKWDQGTPYNNLCPEYATDERAVTGCVATAMAQVMKYHEYANMTTGLPAYNKDYNGNSCISVTALEATSFDWDNMLDSYSNGYTNEQATAVAKLMQYCGSSVKMRYGSSSSSNTNMVATALKTYFDYSNTTTCLERSRYTYANWIELIYHELANGRPVVYGGQSSGGGHEFVCDGYQGEDYFHINWGWGGTSDNYFKLSALDPDAQGIGGSSSTDGFHYGQDAVIGIQPSTGTGTVLDVPTVTVDLSINSVSFSANPTQGKEVTVYINLKNNSNDDYDGDIGIRIYRGSSYVDDVSSDFLIPAHSASKTCELKFTPQYSGSYSVIVYRPATTYGYITFINNQQYNCTVAAGATASNNVELTLSAPVIENTTSRSDNTYYLYGNHFKGYVKVTNSTSTNYEGTFLWALIAAGSSAAIKEVDIYVPAGGSINVPLYMDGLDYNVSYYVLKTSYIKNNSYSMTERGRYYPKAAIMTYTADGTSMVTIPSGTSFDAKTNASEALVVDVSGTSITSITPNDQLNTLYIYSGTMPSGIGSNLVKNNGGVYTAESIQLYDNEEFYSPVDFTAEVIEFNYDFTVGADGTNGWNTIVLPFEVTSVTADDSPIDWFRSGSDKGKNFWLKSFSGDGSNSVSFSFVEGDAMQANTPYIVAFPGNRWGPNWDLSEKQIAFKGQNTTVHKSSAIKSVTGDNFRFIGSTVQDNTENIYCINATGSGFELKEAGGSAPFRAYFKPGTFDRTVTTLTIGSGTGTTTAINDLTPAHSEKEGAWYDLQGRRVIQPTKGLYIVNGKTVIVK